jgi:hypothetical protein
MSTQMNFQGGVNAKHTPSTASCAQAEKGETTTPQSEFKSDVTPAKTYKPKPGPQMNFPNGN